MPEKIARSPDRSRSGRSERRKHRGTHLWLAGIPAVHIGDGGRTAWDSVCGERPGRRKHRKPQVFTRQLKQLRG
jgi:hypothetical protein